MANLYPFQQKLLTDIESGGVKPGEMMIITAGRQLGKSTFAQQYANLYNAIMDSPVKIRWHKLPGRKLHAYAEVGPRGFERGLRDSDMDEVQQWLWTNIPTAKRLSFDTWLFKEDKHITIFLMRWSS
jgi:hypothetical protein